MINSDLLEALGKMNMPMIILLGDEEEEEDSLLLQEMIRHNHVIEDRPFILPSPG